MKYETVYRVVYKLIKSRNVIFPSFKGVPYIINLIKYIKHIGYGDLLNLNHTCPLCGMKFSTFSGLMLHLEKGHDIVNEIATKFLNEYRKFKNSIYMNKGKYTCKICGFKSYGIIKAFQHYLSEHST